MEFARPRQALRKIPSYSEAVARPRLPPHQQSKPYRGVDCPAVPLLYFSAICLPDRGRLVAASAAGLITQCYVTVRTRRTCSCWSSCLVWEDLRSTPPYRGFLVQSRTNIGKIWSSTSKPTSASSCKVSTQLLSRSDFHPPQIKFQPITFRLPFSPTITRSKTSRN